MAYRGDIVAAMNEDEYRKGTWLEEEDERLISFVQLMGDKKWDALAKASGLRRSGKSCRLRWLNYLRPNLKHGQISVEEERIILQLHQQWGNKWSKIARRLVGRTDNEIKNYWRTHLRKKVVKVEENEVKKANHDSFLFESKNTSIPNNPSYENTQYLEGILGNSWEHSSEASATSVDFALTNSPYENRFSDWISEYSYGQNEVNFGNEQCISLDCSSSSSSLESAWTNNHVLDYTDSWDCSGFLWDMN